MRQPTPDVASRLARMGWVEPHTRRARRGPSQRSFHRHRYGEHAHRMALPIAERSTLGQAVSAIECRALVLWLATADAG